MIVLAMLLAQRAVALQPLHPRLTKPSTAVRSAAGGASLATRTAAFCDRQFFVVGMAASVGLAAAAPGVGLAAEPWVGKYAVMLIFVASRPASSFEDGGRLVVAAPPRPRAGLSAGGSRRRHHGL
mmetsp:Transcript_29018/g.89744  ORF Transcript_29018/g.89744 Transcript_29018/m.89744 type:complete len:125 (-) Transcript_29018:329-703(-)